MSRAHQASLSITNCLSSPKLMSIESVMPSNPLILCHPLLLLPSIFPSIRVFSNVSALCIPMDCSTPGFPVITNSRHLHKLMSMELVMPSKHLILCCPLLLLPSIFPSIRVFSNLFSLHISWPKFGALASPSVLPMNIQDPFPLRLTDFLS